MKRPLLILTFLALGCTSTVDTIGTRADETVAKAIDCASTRGVAMLDAAASRAQEVTQKALHDAGNEARLTIDHATQKAQEASQALLTQAQAHLLTVLEAALKGLTTLANELLDKINRWSNRILERVENKTIPAAGAQTKGIVDAISEWWDKIAMAVLTIVGGIYTIRQRNRAVLAETTVSSMAEAGKRMNGGFDAYKQHVEKVLKESLSPRDEYKVRHLIRTKGSKKG